MDFSYSHKGEKKALVPFGISLAPYCVCKPFSIKEGKGSKARKDEQEQICTRKHQFCAKGNAMYLPFPKCWGINPGFFPRNFLFTFKV